MYKFHLAIMALLSLSMFSCSESELENFEDVELETRSIESFTVSFVTNQQSTLTVGGHSAELTYLTSEWSDLIIETDDGLISYVAKQISFDSSSEETLTASNQEGQEHVGTSFVIDVCDDALCLDVPFSSVHLQGTLFIIEDTIGGL